MVICFLTPMDRRCSLRPSPSSRLLISVWSAHALFVDSQSFLVFSCSDSLQFQPSLVHIPKHPRGFLYRLGLPKGLHQSQRPHARSGGIQWNFGCTMGWIVLGISSLKLCCLTGNWDVDVSKSMGYIILGVWTSIHQLFECSPGDSDSMFFDPWPDFNVIMINPAEMIAPPAMSLELMVNGELAWFW